MEHLKIWGRAREDIRKVVRELLFTNIIEPIVPLVYKNDVLVLEVQNSDSLAMLKTYYFEDLLKCVRAAEPSVADVLLVLPAEREKYVVEEVQEPINVYSLNPKYTFDSFIVGGSNQFPHAAAQAVAQNPGASYNPLFIYGGVGLGKTHLMHAIGHYVKEKNPAARVMYVTSETFTNELISAIQQDKRLEFRKRFRNVDILMIDDVQFISRSQATQEEFFNTFNTLHNANKQIVISSDRPPKEISKLEERLCSRFQWGLITDIQPPDLETRIAILRNRARMDNIEVDDTILQFIAEHVQSNIRELEGCLTRVIAYAQLTHLPLTLELTQAALKDILNIGPTIEVTPQRIKATVAEYYSISEESMDSARRDREVVMPRQIAMYLCQKMLGLPYKRIAETFGRNDHTTAMSAVEKIDKMIAGDAKFASVIEDIKKRVSGNFR